jgi:glycerol-3-phosphate acyltransferase PlsX
LDKLITITIDAMGGDYGIDTTVPASLMSLKKHQNLCLILVGDEGLIRKKVEQSKIKYVSSRLKIHHTTQIVGMDESPSLALRQKKDSSMRVAINLVKSKEAQACVSAGNTGALMATSKYVLKTLPEIERPAIVFAMPSMNPETGIVRPVYMLDLGANVNCSSEQLFQFGVMGSVLVSCLTGKERPKVALLNIGEEEMKGLDSIKQAAKILKSFEPVDYVGYIEGNDIFASKADVIVCDGFIGNIALKAIEGSVKFITTAMKETFDSNIFSKAAKLIAAPVLLKLKNKLDVKRYNGASLIGLRGIVIKSHGGVDALSFAVAIDEAVQEVSLDIPTKIQEKVEKFLTNQDVGV